MIRAKLWLRCAAAHDPITPCVARPALIGWEAKLRRVDLVIERSFRGEELLQRMKGWITTDPYKVIEVIKKFAVLKVLDDRELVVEMEDSETFDKLQQALAENFGDQANLELIQKLA